MSKKKSLATSGDVPVDRISGAIMDFIGKIPRSALRKARNPLEVARKQANLAAAKAAVTAGTLALPPGPLGWVTVLPELIGVWKIQAQLVSDIARVYGKSATLNQEHMLYCLFRHSAAQAVRDLTVRVGGRYLIKKASIRAVQSTARRVGVRLTQRGISSAISRWLPIIGAVGIGGYAYYDTSQVAKTAIELFSMEPPFAAESSAE